MKRSILLPLLLLPGLIQAQITVKGIITEQNSGNKPIAGVQIKALGTAPEVTGNDGLFQLVFAGKKAGDRIIVSEIAKKGFEIVNKDLVNNWVITNSPNQRTKIVMCPEGLIAQNTLKYYEISLAGLTQGYQERITALQERMAKAEIDAKTYGEQAKVLAEQYDRQQKQLEELSEKFARENFDDCSAVHREAFEAFKKGNIIEAIGILERVNSADEIARAQEQKEKGMRLEQEGKNMQTASDSVIRQNISKLMFQADLYRSQFRFDDAEKAWETALYADSTDLVNIFIYVSYLLDMFKTEEGYRWNKTALDQANKEYEKAHASVNMGFIYSSMKRFREAETAYSDAVNLYEVLAEKEPRYLHQLSYSLSNLADYYYNINQYEKSIQNHLESVRIRRELVILDPTANNSELARQLQNLAQTQFIANQIRPAEINYREALGIYRELRATDPSKHRFGLAWTLMGIAKLSEADSAEIYYQEALELLRVLTQENYQQFSSFLARLLNGYADLLRGSGRFEEARTLYEEALLISDNLMKLNPMEFNNVYAMALTNLASVEEDLNDFEHAQVHYDMASATWRELVQNNPDVFGKDLASMLHNQAFMYRRMKEFGKADTNYREAISLLREAVKTNPEEITRILALSLHAYTRFLYETNEPGKAVPVFEECMHWFELMASGQPEMYNKGVAHLYGEYAFAQVKNNQFVLAENSARRGLMFDSTETWIYTNLALALLFQDKYDEALEIYLEWKDRPFPGDETNNFRTAFLKDFDDLEKIGIKHQDMKKIRKVLRK